MGKIQIYKFLLHAPTQFCDISAITKMVFLSMILSKHFYRKHLNTSTVYIYKKKKAYKVYGILISHRDLGNQFVVWLVNV